ncbi:MAG: Gfo/Idh/MocA family oxidoreductase [Spirochaetes bacterium]|nr:Gfo/Idh/MocA family oxidoreductase [Spirochaetota bacterium]
MERQAMGTTAPLRLAIVGVGNMGYQHVQTVSSLERVVLAGISDVDQGRLDRAAAHTAAPRYLDYGEMLDKEKPDAVLIATPHYDHTGMAIEAFRRGMHVLVEKPVGVHGLDVRRTIAAHEEAKKKKPGLVFAAMFNQRTYGHWRKIKALIEEGELGRLVRTTWIITDWFRSQSYFDSGGWRATWKGEGGGVLLNQCPHNLDLFQWLVGIPDRVTGFASLGKYHNIEVEDEVTAYFEYQSGAVGHFITTTAESPGTNRLEIVGENGKLVFENGELVFHRNRSSMLEFLRVSTTSFDKVECWQIKVPFQHHGEGGHRLIIENFAAAVLDGSELIAPAAEGLHSVLMANAVMHSSLNGHRPVELPMDEAAFAKELQDLIAASGFTKKTATPGGSEDMAKSYGR